MRMICDRCGNDDAERIGLMTEPVERDGKLIGWELVGWRCLCCGLTVRDNALDALPDEARRAKRRAMTETQLDAAVSTVCRGRAA